MSTGRRLKILDGEILYKQYFVEMGDARSIPKLIKFATGKYGRNPVNGKEWTKGGVWQSMWRWAFENLDEAKNIYQDVQLRYGFEFTDEDWDYLIATRARTLMTSGQYRRFVGEHPELEIYEVL